MQAAIHPHATRVKESATLAINQTVARLRDQGREVCHLGFGESPFPVPPALEQALQDEAHRKSYLPTQGLPELREAVAAFYRERFGYAYPGSHVVVGPGSKELLFQLMFLLEGPLILPGPCWVSYEPQARLCNKPVFTLPGQYDQQFRVDAQRLALLLESMPQGQKLMVLNSPNNPTGLSMTQAEAVELGELCRKHQVIVISDEIYALTTEPEQPLYSLAQTYPEGTIVTGGLSKAFSAGGYRLGLALLPAGMETLRRAMVSTISETFSAVTAPVQYAALQVYGNYPAVAEHVESCTHLHRLAGNWMTERFRAMGLQCHRPTGGFYLFPGFAPFREALASQGMETATRLCTRLLEEAQVAMLPGGEFMVPDEWLHARVASVDFDGAEALQAWASGVRQPEALFPSMAAGLERLEAWLKKRG